jgi:hypothetical protein
MDYVRDSCSEVVVFFDRECGVWLMDAAFPCGKSKKIMMGFCAGQGYLDGYDFWRQFRESLHATAVLC